MGRNFSFEQEYYKCYDCSKVLSYGDMRTSGKLNWKCPHCNGTIMVYAKDTDWNYVLLRKYAYEIDESDSILMYPNSHTVLNNTYASGKHKIALKGYGVLKADELDWLNCIWGQWDGDETKFDK